MPIALPAIDLAALAGVMLLIGLLAVVGYTFKRLADVLNFSVLGVHPLQHVASAIENTIVAGCNAGINTLDKWAIALYHGLTYCIGLILDGVEDLANGAYGAIDRMVTHTIPSKVNAALSDVTALSHSAASAIAQLRKDVDADAAKLTSLVKSLNTTISREIQAFWHGEVTNVHAYVNNQIAHHDNVVHQIVNDAVAGIHLPGDIAASTLTGAAKQALENAQAAEDAIRGELHDLLGNANPGDVAALIAAIPVIRALVQTLESETGLENASCRAKVKSICATPTDAWDNLLALALPLGLALSLRALYEPARETFNELHDLIEAAA